MVLQMYCKYLHLNLWGPVTIVNRTCKAAGKSFLLGTVFFFLNDIYQNLNVVARDGLIMTILAKFKLSIRSDFLVW